MTLFTSPLIMAIKVLGHFACETNREKRNQTLILSLLGEQGQNGSAEKSVFKTQRGKYNTELPLKKLEKPQKIWNCNVLSIERKNIMLLQPRENHLDIKKGKKGHSRHCIIHVYNVIIIAK